MTNIFNRSRYLAWTLLLLTATASTGHASPRPSAVVRQSTQSRSIKDLWEARHGQIERRSKDYPKAKLDALLTLLRQAAPEQVSSESERIAGADTAYARLSDYDQTLVQALVVRALERKDQKSLVSLLAAKCPRYVSDLPLELFLAVNTKESVLLLFESYEAAQNEDARKSLFEALRCSFRDLHGSSAHGETFLTTAREWFLKNRARYKVNPLYKPYSLSPHYHALFVPAQPSRRNKRFTDRLK